MGAGVRYCNPVKINVSVMFAMKNSNSYAEEIKANELKQKENTLPDRRSSKALYYFLDRVTKMLCSRLFVPKVFAVLG